MSLLQTAEQISNSVRARVQACTVANGAETDLGRLVFRGRRVVDDDMIPCAVILEGEDRVEEQASLHVNVKQQYLLYAYVPADPNDPNVAAHKALRDLKRAIFRTNGKPDATWGRTVTKVHYQGKDIGPRTDGAAFVLVVFDFAVEYVESLANP